VQTLLIDINEHLIFSTFVLNNGTCKSSKTPPPRKTKLTNFIEQGLGFGGHRLCAHFGQGGHITLKFSQKCEMGGWTMEAF